MENAATTRSSSYTLENALERLTKYTVWVSCIGEGEREQKHLLGIQIFNFVEENEEYLSQSYFKAEAGTGKRTNGFELVLFVN